MSSSHTVRRHIVIVQPVIPLYNVPLFESLSALPQVDLTLLADLRASNQLNQYNPERHRFKAIHVSTWSIGGIVFRPTLFRRIREIKPSIVIVSGSPREWSQLALLLYCRLTGIPVGVWSMFHRIGRRRLVTEVIMRSYALFADLTLSYSERGQREQIRRGASPERTVVLTTALDERSIVAVRNKVTTKDLKAFRARVGLEGKRVLLHAVRLTGIKRPDVMVRLFEELVRRRSDVVLVLIGGGPLELQIRRLVDSADLNQHVRFVGHLYDEWELACWHMISDVFVIATCVGLSAHRAFCYGLPVVTDDCLETQASEFELLIDGENSLLYRAGDARDFVDKVTRLLNDSDLRRRMSLNAMDRVEREFTLNQKVSRFDLAFRLLADSTSARDTGAQRTS